MKKLVVCSIISMLAILPVLAVDNSIRGAVVAASSEEAIDFASIAVVDKKTGELVAGGATANGGKFVVQSPIQEVYVEISFMGYKALRVDNIVFKNHEADLGTIPLTEDTKALDEVRVSADKSTLEFKLDKRVFNVGADLSTSGASALEVLNNVPSVHVNIEGEVFLRGSGGVQLLLNGKPSILADDGMNALGTITADMIAQVEVITNPSAKYEAEGSVGIINIVLKKEDREGLNGSVTINGGVPENYNIGLSINRRTERFNLFTQLGTGYKELPRNSENINIDKSRNSEIRSSGTPYRNETFYNIILGSDYYINPQNVITLSGSYTYEIEDQPSEMKYDSLSEGITEKIWKRHETTEARNPKYQYELRYKSDFKDHKDHVLLFSAIGRYFGKKQSSLFIHENVYKADSMSDQKTETDFNEGKYTFNLDYTKPFNDAWQIETGAQYLINGVSNDYSVSDEVVGQFVVNEGLTNVFEYNQKVLGVYGTGAYEGILWGLKLGLRAENTDLQTLLRNTNEDNSRRYTNWFPSVHTSYKVAKCLSLQAGYSRRIYRPRLWDLNPFFNIRNTNNRRAGNPVLQPEFTDSYELGSIFTFDKLSYNIIAYHRYTTDKIERVSSVEDNINTHRPENVGTNKATGLELSFKYSPIKMLTFNSDAFYNVFKREGSYNNQVFDFTSEQWSGKLSAKYKVTKDFDLEFTGRHVSRERTVQGTLSAHSFADMGAKLKILDGRGVFTLSIRDIFESRFRENEIDNEAYYIYARDQRGRFISFGFSYGFGKGEAMQYSGGHRHR